MRPLSPGELPTVADLEAAGTDAGALLDATRDELNRAIGAAQDKATRTELAGQLDALDRLQSHYFGGGA